MNDVWVVIKTERFTNNDYYSGILCTNIYSVLFRANKPKEKKSYVLKFMIVHIFFSSSLVGWSDINVDLISASLSKSKHNIMKIFSFPISQDPNKSKEC